MYLNNSYKLFALLLIASNYECSQYRITDQIFFDVSIDEHYIGKIILGLFGDVAPRTCKNFKEISINGIDGKSYVGTKFHTAIVKVMIQGGDVVNNDGTGSTSIYGKYFDDENFIIKPDSAGLLVEARTAPDADIILMSRHIVETRPYILASSLFGEKLRNTHQHTIRSLIANAFEMKKRLEVFEEVSGIAEIGSLSGVDDLAIDRTKNESYIINTTIIGPNQNGCQFFITTMSTPWLEGKNVVFGKVLKGHEVVHRIEHLKTDVDDKLLNSVVITNVGTIKTEPFYESSKNYELTFWAWIKAGWIPLSFSFAIMAFFQYFIIKLDKIGKDL